MKLLRVLFYILLIVQTPYVFSESFINADKSERIHIDKFRNLTSEQKSILRINYESVFEIIYYRDDKLSKLLKSDEITDIAIQTHGNEIEWHALDKTDISLKKKSNYLRVYFPMQTFKMREAIKNGENLVIGLKKGSQEIIRSYTLKVDCKGC